MTYCYRVTEDAERDLVQLGECVLSYAGLDFVERLEDKFLSAFERLCKNPYAHPVYTFEPSIETLHEYRGVNVCRYKVFYWIDGDEVEIYLICHLVSDFTRRAF